MPRLSRSVEAQDTIKCRLCRCFVVNQETLPYVQQFLGWVIPAAIVATVMTIWCYYIQWHKEITGYILSIQGCYSYCRHAESKPADDAAHEAHARAIVASLTSAKNRSRRISQQTATDTSNVAPHGRTRRHGSVTWPLPLLFVLVQPHTSLCENIAANYQFHNTPNIIPPKQPSLRRVWNPHHHG
ncbi:hypothetical protein J6590_038481 [Homalodisca vitripennis]|nr:hypothetical protein J6590_038481 [Homalodisca vitripennis]